MQRGVLWTYLSLFKTAWIYIASGALRDVMKLRNGPVPVAHLTVRAKDGIWLNFQSRD